MKRKTLISIALIVALAIGFVACNGNKNNGQSGSNDKTASQVVDNKDEITFLRTFLDNYLQLHGKQAQELARKHLTQEFYSDYIEYCNNQDNAIDLICECEAQLGEKVEKVDTIMKGIEEPNIFVTQVIARDAEGKDFTIQYAMTVVKEDNKFKLSDSQIND